MLGLAMAMAGCAGAGDPLTAGAPWQCAMIHQGATAPEPGFQVGMRLAKSGALDGQIVAKIPAADGLHELEAHLEGDWKRVEKGVELAMRPPRLTRLALDGQEATQEQLVRENASVSGMMSSYVPGAMTIAELSKDRLKLESETSWMDCRPAGAAR